MLHLADLHLGWNPPWEDIASRRREERDRRLFSAVSWALKHQIDLVVIAGDLFETHRPDESLVASVRNDLKRLVDAGVSVVTVPGNHDEISYHDSVYRSSRDWPGLLIQQPNFDFAATIDVRGEKVHLYSMAYTSGLTRTDPPLSDFPHTGEDGWHIALLHGSLGWGTADRSLPINTQALTAAGYDYVALGHIHQHQIHGERVRPVVYCGMVDGKGFDDPGVGVYTVVTLEKGTPAKVEKVEVESRPVTNCTFDAGAYPDQAALEEAMNDCLEEGAIARVTLTGVPAFAMSTEALRDSLKKRVLYLEILDESTGLSDDALAAMAKEPTVRGAFVSGMLKRLAGCEPDDEEGRRVLQRALTLGLQALGGARRGR